MLKLDRKRHELSCANCGAPLRDLKMLPKQTQEPRPAVSHRSELRHFPEKMEAVRAKHAKPRKTRKRKKWLKSFAEEVFDLVEDIFD